METALHGALTEQISAWFSSLPDAGPKHAAPACHRFCPSYHSERPNVPSDRELGSSSGDVCGANIARASEFPCKVNRMPAVEQRKPAFSITNRAEFRFLFSFQALALSHCLSRAKRRPDGGNRGVDRRDAEARGGAAPPGLP